MNDAFIKQIFNGNVILNGTGTHFITQCPFCNKKEHLYIQRKTQKVDKYGKNASWSFICQKCKRGGRLRSLLIKLGLVELLGKFTPNSDLFGPLKKISKTEREDLPQNNIFPVGYRRVTYHCYLEQRGFVPEDYSRYPCGIARVIEKDKDYIFFPVVQNKISVGYVGRRLDDQKSIPKYNNSKTLFESLLYGIDDVEEETKQVLLVEGIFDKRNVDKELDLYKDASMRCVATFGSSFTTNQLNRLVVKGVEEVVIMHDLDALSHTKDFLFKLTDQFLGILDIKAALVSNYKDPGMADEKTLKTAILNKQDPVSFNLSHIKRKTL